MKIDFLNCLNSRFDTKFDIQLICNFVDILTVDNLVEIVEKIDLNKHCFDSEIEKTEIDAVIEMIVAKIATDDY